MPLQHICTNEATGTVSSEAYGIIQSLNIVDINEIFKTVLVDGIPTVVAVPCASVTGKYNVYHDVTSYQEEMAPICSIHFSIGNGFPERDTETMELTYVEKLDDSEHVYLLWDDVFGSASDIDFTSRETMKDNISDAIEAYMRTKVIAGIDLTEAIVA